MSGSDPKDALLYFSKAGMTILTVPIGSNCFDGPIYPTAAELPCRSVIIKLLSTNIRTKNIYFRIILVILNRGQLIGDRTKNPYLFRRKFDSVFIKKISISINGQDISGLNNEATELEDNTGYSRMIHAMGNANSLFSNGIDFHKFLDNAFYSVWDLSTARRPCNDISKND